MTLGDIVLLIQAIIVVGGGFYLFGRLGAKLDSLASAIVRLATSLDDHEARIRALEIGGS